MVAWEDGVEGKMVTLLTPNYGSGYTNLYVLKFIQIYVKKSQCNYRKKNNYKSSVVLITGEGIIRNLRLALNHKE